MATNRTRNWLVIFQPEGEETVATMKVIDAWATTGGTKAAAERTMRNHSREYVEKHGEGRVYCVEQGKGWWL